MCYCYKEVSCDYGSGMFALAVASLGLYNPLCGLAHDSVFSFSSFVIFLDIPLMQLLRPAYAQVLLLLFVFGYKRFFLCILPSFWLLQYNGIISCCILSHGGIFLLDSCEVSKNRTSSTCFYNITCMSKSLQWSCTTF